MVIGTKGRRWGNKPSKDTSRPDDILVDKSLDDTSVAQKVSALEPALVMKERSAESEHAMLHSIPQQLVFPLDPERDARGLGAGDSFLISHFLAKDEADVAFEALLPEDYGGTDEVQWMQMYGKDGRPFARLKNTQADLDEPTDVPIYRYPTNNQVACVTEAWSDTVGRIKERVAVALKQPINHCVANLYRNAFDYIGPHKDKMLDIQAGSAIASLSLGAVRPILLEREGSEDKQMVPLRHGSLFVIGPETNLLWTHSIPRHARPCGPRISLTLRWMSTFMNMDTGSIRGQGAGWTSICGMPRALASSRYQDPNWPLWTHDADIKPTVAYFRRSTLRKELRSHFVEQGSTFDCLIVPCTDLEEVSRSRQRIRDEYPDAVHIPSAWMIRRQRVQPSQSSLVPKGRRTSALQGWDCDGEPVINRRYPGDAGENEAKSVDTGRDGLFDMLREAHITDCAAFVIRHWDGNKLGLVRLVEAYKASMRLALACLLAGDDVAASSNSPDDFETTRAPR